MRLSDIKGERTLDVIADIIEPIANIASDEEAADLFVRKPLPKGMKPKEFLLKRVKKSVPKLIKSHKSDLITILASFEGITPKEYTDKLNMITFTKDVIELLTDETFGALFISSAQTPEQSGTAPESTEDHSKQERS